MGLRDAIAAKQRRTATLPVLVGDLAAAAAEAATLRAALQVQQEQRGAKTRPTKAEEQTRADLQAALQAAQQRQAACVVEVELQALPADEWEALVGPLQPDDDGELDLSKIHAVALAASCTDPELQDADWWAEQLKGPQWSKGDRAAISNTLMTLNWFTPLGVPGKD